MIEMEIPDAAAMHALGERLATFLRAGDLVLLGGSLGAGKTTLTQGIGAGLGIRGPVTSPTFIIARVHPSLVGGAPLVHVDAYRLTGWDELEDLDLEATLEEVVTVVEWGEGLAEGLAGERLEIHIDRAARQPESTTDAPDGADVPDGATDVPGSADVPEDATDVRRVRVAGVGPRWAAEPALRTLPSSLPNDHVH